VFHLPGPSDQPDITLTGSIYATAFDDRPAVMATMAYLLSAEFADTRARLTEGDFLSPNRNVDTSLYPGRQQAFATILSTAEPVRFDASDLMPGVVGADAFLAGGGQHHPRSQRRRGIRRRRGGLARRLSARLGERSRM
jgi:alpha-glucoside transport system substrate-binding protein